MDRETLAALDAWLQDEPEPLECLYCPQWHEHPEWLGGQLCPCPCHETDGARDAEREAGH